MERNPWRVGVLNPWIFLTNRKVIHSALLRISRNSCCGVCSQELLTPYWPTTNGRQEIGSRLGGTGFSRKIKSFSKIHFWNLKNIERVSLKLKLVILFQFEHQTRSKNWEGNLGRYILSQTTGQFVIRNSYRSLL